MKTSDKKEESSVGNNRRRNTDGTGRIAPELNSVPHETPAGEPRTSDKSICGSDDSILVSRDPDKGDV